MHPSEMEFRGSFSRIVSPITPVVKALAGTPHRCRSGAAVTAIFVSYYCILHVKMRNIKQINVFVNLSDVDIGLTWRTTFTKLAGGVCRSCMSEL